MTDKEMAEEYCNNEVPFDTTESGEKLYTENDLKNSFLAGYEACENNAEQYKPRWHSIKKDGPPPKAGLYLCYRRWHYTDMYELIYWTGEYWVTGRTSYDVIFAWCEIPEFKE